MYKEFDFDYDPNLFIEIFKSNGKENSMSPFLKTLYPINEDDSIKPFYENFNFVPTDRRSLELMEILVPVGPYISPRNNGLIFFPVSGVLEFNFYSYTSNTFVNGRPILPPRSANNNYKNIEHTLVETIQVTGPVAINGLVTHKYTPLEFPTLVFVLKIPMHIPWEDVVSAINSI
jgi:hypothetical protein